MNKTILIQRLNDPSPGFKVGDKVVDNPFLFGGGLRNGGLSQAAMDLLRPIFEFDYMGRAEFEFGAVPKALTIIKDAAVKNELVAFQVSGLPKPIFGLAPKEITAEAAKVIRHLAKQQYNRDLKESTYLYDALNPETNKFPIRAKGWLELDNGFFFTVDRVMFEKMATLMGVKV